MCIEVNIQAINGDKKKCLAIFRLNPQTIQEVIAGVLEATVPNPAPEDTPAEQEQPHADNQQPAEPAKPIAYDYKVRSVKPSGQNSLFLELVDKGGKVTAAYIKAGEQTITVGSCLNNVDIQRKNGTYGEFNLINTYQVAA
jgi:hypothetical protein